MLFTARAFSHRKRFDLLFSPHQEYGDKRLELVGDKAGLGQLGEYRRSDTMTAPDNLRYTKMTLNNGSGAIPAL